MVLSSSFLCFSLLLLSLAPSCLEGKTELLLQALLPYKTPLISDYSALPAIKMALQDINDFPSLLSDYRLTVKVADTNCDSSISSWKLIQSILNTTSINDTKIIAFVGGACSLATEPTAALSGNLYNIVQISHSATSPALSDRRQYPLFFRLAPSETLLNEARFAFSNMYNWCKVANLYHTENIFSLAVIDFHDRFKSFLDTNVCNDTDYQPQLFSFPGDPLIPLQQIKDSDFRIINGYFYEEQAIVVLCYALHLDLTTPNHQWTLPGFYANNWWAAADNMDWSTYSYNCTSEDIASALNTVLLLDFYPFLLDPNTVTFSGHTNTTFYDRFIELYQSEYNRPATSTGYPTLMYDTIWSLALALNDTHTYLSSLTGTTTPLSHFMYTHSDHSTSLMMGSLNETSFINITHYLKESLKKTNFLGVSGQVQFDDSGTRLSINSISQYQHTGDSLVKVHLAIYDYYTDGLNITYFKRPVWKLGRAPADRSMPESKLLSPPLIYSMDVIVAIGILIAIGFLIFNTVTIRKPLIANSAPFINSVITVGCIVMMSSSILLGIDSGTPQVTIRERINVLEDIDKEGTDRYSIICTVRLWLLSIGFTLSFGALFAKTWLSYRIHVNEKKIEIPFKIWHFLVLMGILLTIDVLFLSIWTGLFPFRHGIEEIDNAENNVITKIEKCECSYFSYLIGTLYVYKGLLVVFGLFLAYESRNVKYFYINDSRFVSISMYIVVILIGISAPLSLVLADRYIIDPAYVIAVIMIVTACMSCLCILYIPKFFYMYKGADTMIVKTKAELFSPVDNLKLGYQEELEEATDKTVHLTSYNTSQLNTHVVAECSTSGDNPSPTNSSPVTTERKTDNDSSIDHDNATASTPAEGSIDKSNTCTTTLSAFDSHNVLFEKKNTNSSTNEIINSVDINNTANGNKVPPEPNGRILCHEDVKTKSSLSKGSVGKPKTVRLSISDNSIHKENNNNTYLKEESEKEEDNSTDDGESDGEIEFIVNMESPC